MLLSAGIGIGPTKSAAGALKRRTFSSTRSACAASPVKHQTIAHAFVRCRGSGNGGPGGTVMVAKNP